MKIHILTFTEMGYRLAVRLQGLLSGDDVVLHVKSKALPEISEDRDIYSLTGSLFQEAEALLFIGACGIAVRAIAPCLVHKKEDPAVLVMDEQGRYVISLLSGHLGGANALTKRIASAAGAAPVITTASDLEGKFSVDLFAKENGLVITDFEKAKAIQALLLREKRETAEDGTAEGEETAAGVRIYTTIPKHRLKLPADDRDVEIIAFSEGIAEPFRASDILIAFRTVDPAFPGLCLVPKCIVVGIGARKGVTEDEVNAGISRSLADLRIPEEAVEKLVSIDLKAQEEGILAWSYRHEIPFVTYTAEELRSADGSFASSAFVQSVTGVSNVCERAAAYGSHQGRILLHKTIHGNVTVAVAECLS